jgi:hypothetical protein
MLISMPTGTSTIFGVFQAILALLVSTGRMCALAVKLIPFKKFASEIFFPTPLYFMLHRTRIHSIVRPAVKPKADQRVQE